MAIETIAQRVNTPAPMPPRFQFAGFDCGAYPGDAAMTAWSGGKSPYSYVCYYLDAPCHTRKGFAPPWSGKRALLNQLGWGFIITYVGRQPEGCGSEALSRDEGLVDGNDAVAETRAEGFPAGATIFLDVEGGGPLPQPYLDYFGGWIAAVIASEFTAGVYCGLLNRMALAVAAQTQYAAKDPVGNDTATLWLVSLSPKFSLTCEPGECGVSYAAIWQGKFGVKNELHNGVTVPLIDLDVALSPDPSRGRIQAPIT